MKGPRFNICYWWISLTLGSGIAGFNCSQRKNDRGDVRITVEGGGHEGKETYGCYPPPLPLPPSFLPFPPRLNSGGGGQNFNSWFPPRN